MHKQARGLFVAMAGLSAAGLVPCEASAADLDVGSGQIYATIQAAADAAQAGDTIRVHAGSYAEDLALDASGSSGTPIILQGGIDGDVTVAGRVTLDGSWWEIRDLAVEPTAGLRAVRLRGDHNLLSGLARRRRLG